MRLGINSVVALSNQMEHKNVSGFLS